MCGGRERDNKFCCLCLTTSGFAEAIVLERKTIRARTRGEQHNSRQDRQTDRDKIHFHFPLFSSWVKIEGENGENGWMGWIAPDFTTRKVIHKRKKK